MKQYLISLGIALCILTACAGNKNETKTDPRPVPVDPELPQMPPKPIRMWVDAHANMTRFADKAAITTYVEKIKETGFTGVYVDVKPGIGYALYDSDILPQLTKWGPETIERNFDYLGYWIEEADRVGLDVIASISTLGYGATRDREGLIYDSDKWNGKSQVEMPDPKTGKLIDMRDQYEVDAVMLNPTLPEVQEFVTSIVEEIVRKYPKLKGVCLDYCRWYGSNYGFGDVTLQAFENYYGKKGIKRDEILTDTGGIGPLYKHWIEFRTSTITNLVTHISTRVKALNPQLEFHFWASAHWTSRYTVGQNWASKNYKPTPGDIYTENYNKTGFADQLDVFSLGAYADAVWNTDDPTTNWTVENFVNDYPEYIMDDCSVHGSFTTYGYVQKPSLLSDAMYLSLHKTDGVMVFELSHVIRNNQWDILKEGINRVYKK